MPKWAYLYEADEDIQSLKRVYASEGTPESAVAYINALIRRTPVRADIRFNRLLSEFREDPSTERTEWLLRDISRVTGPKNREVSEHCRLRGKMGNVCNQANQTEVTTTYFVILVSYQTPVAYRVRASRNEPNYRSEVRHSVTTTQQVGRWVNLPIEDVTQAEITELYYHR